MKTLITEHWAGQVRGAGRNDMTRIVPLIHAARLVGPDMRTLFERAYPSFADRCRAIEEPGVAIIAADELTGNAMGMACLHARVDRHVAAIIGRHDKCDLYVVGNDELALRQLAVVLAPVSDWRAGASSVSFRILDLRTAEGMIDEDARPLRALRSEGAAMVRCGGYAIFALPLGDPTDWPASASDAWDCMPERIYHDELVRVPDASIVRELVPARTNITRVTRMAGPRDTAMPLVSGRDVAGRLSLRGSWGTGAIDVGHQALREGVLLGRYARCDGGLGLSADSSLSRVHALLLLVDNRLLAIDVASTNGTRAVGQPDARVIELAGDTELELADSTVRWSWSS